MKQNKNLNFHLWLCKKKYLFECTQKRKKISHWIVVTKYFNINIAPFMKYSTVGNLFFWWIWNAFWMCLITVLWNIIHIHNIQCYRIVFNIFFLCVSSPFFIVVTASQCMQHNRTIYYIVFFYEFLEDFFNSHTCMNN